MHGAGLPTMAAAVRCHPRLLTDATLHTGVRPRHSGKPRFLDARRGGLPSGTLPAPLRFGRPPFLPLLRAALAFFGDLTFPPFAPMQAGHRSVTCGCFGQVGIGYT